jgi:DNA methylase
MPDQTLVYYDAARKALEKASTFNEVKKIRDKAEALRLYARQSGESLEMQNRCAEIKLRAERRAGELIAPNLKHGGDRKSKSRFHDGTLIEMGISKKQSHRWQAIAKIPEQVFEQHIAETKEKAEELTSIGVRKLGRNLSKEQQRTEAEEKQREAIKAISSAAIDAVADLRVGYMEEILPTLWNLDAIITDPPYSRDALPLYASLASYAFAALKPNGVLAVMCGQSYLPEVLECMTRGQLRYRWAMAYLTPGGQAVQLWDRSVNTFWKPVLIFGGSGKWIGDVVSSNINDNDKRFHEWGQSESGILQLVERLTEPEAQICDPFLGGGTTAVAAVMLGRRIVGCDIDKSAVSTARARVAEVLNEPGRLARSS